jgi:hypothetical protein
MEKPIADFKEMVDNMTMETLTCTVAAIILMLEQIAPNSEAAITNLANTLITSIAGTNEQDNEGTTE